MPLNAKAATAAKAAAAAGTDHLLTVMLFMGLPFPDAEVASGSSVGAAPGRRLARRRDALVTLRYEERGLLSTGAPRGGPATARRVA